MWGNIFREPWRDTFQTNGNYPFTGFDGIFGERPHYFWDSPVYFPYDKQRRVSNRKKATRIEDEALTSSNPVCCHPREKPAPKELDDKKLKDETRRTGPSQPKLSRTTVDNPVNIQPDYEESSWDINKNVAEETNESQQKAIEAIELSTGDEAITSEAGNHPDSDVESAKEFSPVQHGTHSTEEQKLIAIKTQLAKARELIPRVKAFEGSRKDKQFLYLEEHLTRCILGLDLIKADGLENVKLARKAAVKEILSVINDLESNVKE